MMLLWFHNMIDRDTATVLYYDMSSRVYGMCSRSKVETACTTTAAAAAARGCCMTCPSSDEHPIRYRDTHTLLLLLVVLCGASLRGRHVVALIMVVIVLRGTALSRPGGEYSVPRINR